LVKTFLFVEVNIVSIELFYFFN